MQEKFKLTRTWDEREKKHHTYINVVCSECGKLDSLSVNSAAGLPPEMVVKKMQQRGWVMGQRRQHDVCPDCIIKRVSEKKVTNIADHPKKNAEPVSTAPVMAPVPPPIAPSTSRENKRLVILALEERYLDAQRGYDAGWSDERIAKDLSVPRKLVADIREEFYGPELDVEVAKLRTEVHELDAKLSTLQTVLSDLRAKHNDLKERLSKKGML